MAAVQATDRFSDLSPGNALALFPPEAELLERPITLRTGHLETAIRFEATPLEFAAETVSDTLGAVRPHRPAFVQRRVAGLVPIFLTAGRTAAVGLRAAREVARDITLARMPQYILKTLISCTAVTATWFLITALTDVTPPLVTPAVPRPVLLVGASAQLPRPPEIFKVSSRPTRARVAASRQRARAVRAPAPFTGALSVRSIPSGAVVLVDQKPIGETPLSTLRLRAGSHAIWIEHAGYQRWSAAVHVPADTLTHVAATLILSQR
jgi:hypothetical protein